MALSTGEVSDQLKRSMNTTIKIATAAIEFHRSKIRELEAVVRASQKVADDMTLPNNMKEIEHYQALIAPAPVASAPLLTGNDDRVTSVINGVQKALDSEQAT